MPQLFTNNASTVLNGAINNTTTTIVVANGAVFPAPTDGDYFLATLIGLDGSGNENAWEIVRVTARSSNTLTVVRGQEGTAAVSWANATRCEMRLTAGSLDVRTTEHEAKADPHTQYLEIASNLQDINNATTARTNLGLGTAATATLTASTTDSTTGRVLKVGDFGIGSIAVSATSQADGFFDTITTSGVWQSNVGNTVRLGGPEATLGFLISNSASTLYSSQLWLSTSGASAGRVWSRALNNGVWTAWWQLYHTGNLLGTVSQSAGVPTGAVIEKGSNANGEFTRLADGTQICTLSLALSGTAATTWTFPAAFVDANARVGTVPESTTAARIVTSAAPTTTAVALHSWSAGTTRVAATARLIAIGRWF